MQIRNSEELHKLLSKAYQIETEYETLAEWEGYVSVQNPKYRDLLFELISDSEKHAFMVKDLLSMVLLPQNYHAPVLQPASFNFSRKSEFDVMLELERYEQLTLDLYSAIRDAVLKSDVETHVRSGDLDAFVAILDKLIVDEAHHRDAVHSYVGGVKMIR